VVSGNETGDVEEREGEREEV